MHDDYYSHQPRFVLSQPIVLTGTFHSDVRRVAHYLAGQCGLPLLDIDDIVSHELGQSILGLRKRDGAGAYLGQERRALARLLPQRPAGIIRAGQDCVGHAATMRLVQLGAQIYYVGRADDFESTDLDSPRFSWTQFFSELGRRSRRASVRAGATWSVDAGDRHALNVAREILGQLSSVNG